MASIGNFYSISQIQTTNASNGYHWFSPASMRWFNSRVHDAVYSGCVFVTSERNDVPYRASQPRAYSVRIAMADGSIETYGSIGDYATRSQAHTQAQWLGKALKDGTVAYNSSTYKFEPVELIS
jgi:hypothetical protein